MAAREPTRNAAGGYQLTDMGRRSRNAMIIPKCAGKNKRAGIRQPTDPPLRVAVDCPAVAGGLSTALINPGDDRFSHPDQIGTVPWALEGLSRHRVLH